jgi:hypothetical protein
MTDIIDERSDGEILHDLAYALRYELSDREVGLLERLANQMAPVAPPPTPDVPYDPDEPF